MANAKPSNTPAKKKAAAPKPVKRTSEVPDGKGGTKTVEMVIKKS